MKTLNFLTGKWEAPKPQKRSKAPEAAVAREIDAYLKASGCYSRQINSGGTFRNGKWLPSGQGRGISDRIGVLPGGRHISCEIKAEGKKSTLSPEQYTHLLRVIEQGGVGVVADSVHDVQTALAATKEAMLSALEQYKPKPPKGSSAPLFP